jgi:hypothetical protein
LEQFSVPGPVFFCFVSPGGIDVAADPPSDSAFVTNEPMGSSNVQKAVVPAAVRALTAEFHFHAIFLIGEKKKMIISPPSQRAMVVPIPSGK